MLTGILLGHALEEHFGLRPHRDGATTLTDSLAMLLQFHVAGRLTRQAFGPRFAAWERGLDSQAEMLSQGPPLGRFGNFGFPATALGRPGARALLPTAGPRDMAPAPELPTLVFMTGKGRGGGSGPQDLEAARLLRLQIAPEEAWRRRAEQAADYVARLKSLPAGRRETLEEAQQGLDLLGTWAAGRDGFRKAIAFRHYLELWRFLADGWRPASLNAAMTESFRVHVNRHRELLGAERNPRFLQAALEASPQIGRIYSHTQAALIEGSPRERDLSESLESLLAVLRTGAESPKVPELRPRYLEAFHDTLNNSVGNSLGLAREAHAGIRLARRWMLEADAERRALGGNYFPLFWRRLAERAHPGFNEAVMEELREEIVFLQRHLQPYRVSQEILIPTLRAFPHYAETVYQSAGPAPGNTFMLTQVFLAQAGSLRPWISEHADPQVRAECGRTYLRLMDQVQARAAEILEHERLFPVSINQKVVQELTQALGPFTLRLKAQEAEELLQALRDYQELVLLLPPRPDLAGDLLSETNLKPLMRLQYHPDPRIRPAIEELLVKLLHRFSAAAPGGGSSN